MQKIKEMIATIDGLAKVEVCVRACVCVRMRVCVHVCSDACLTFDINTVYRSVKGIIYLPSIQFGG